jgi:Trk K+ transport system NAD-binding subunit
MNVPGAYQSIPTIPELISMSATLSSENNLVGKSIFDAESKIGCRIVMIERINEEGMLGVQIPTQVENLEASDRIYIFLEKSDIKRVERSLEN